MFTNSLKVFHRILVSGLVVILCLLFLQNLFNHQNAYKTMKRFIHKSVPTTQYINNNSRISTISTATEEGTNQLSEATAVVLWWTPFIDEMEYTKNCGNFVCFFTGKHKYFQHEKLKVLLFYGSNLNITNLPLPRSPHHVWALFHEESPKNIPYLLFDPAISQFNLTATYSQKSNLPLTLQSLEGYKALIDKKYFIDVQEKNRLQYDEGLAPVLYVQSICDTMSGRDDYVAELMKYIKIDSYGKCLNNRQMPKGLGGEDYLNTIDTDDFRKFIARYKFVIAYENSVCNDYITEKLWRPLNLGVVPIYFGAPNVKKWLPNPESAILISDIQSPKQLANHIMYLNNNDKAYNALLSHKINETITNEILRDELNHRNYETNSIIEDFECFACQKALELSDTDNEVTQSKNVVEHHYENCALTYPQMSRRPATSTEWESMLEQGKCEASLLKDYVYSNTPITWERHHADLIKRFESGQCGN